MPQRADFCNIGPESARLSGDSGIRSRGRTSGNPACQFAEPEQHHEAQWASEKGAKAYAVSAGISVRALYQARKRLRARGLLAPGCAEVTTAPRFTKVAVAAARARNVTIIEAAPDDTTLPSDCCDPMLLRHVYHHITHPRGMDASMFRALRPGGLVAIIDFEPFRLLAVPEGVPEGRGGHGRPIDVLIEEMTHQGFDVERRIHGWFRFDYCVLFRRRVQLIRNRGRGRCLRRSSSGSA